VINKPHRHGDTARATPATQFQISDIRLQIEIVGFEIEVRVKGKIEAEGNGKAYNAIPKTHHFPASTKSNALGMQSIYQFPIFQFQSEIRNLQSEIPVGKTWTYDFFVQHQ
jgi:hypothetical protein